jgi:cytochrome c-type biogenesis protein
MATVTIIIAFIAGIVSFLSPCVLPLLPGFLSYLSGRGANEKSGNSRLTLFLHSVAYVAGFAGVFALLNGILAHIAGSVQSWLSRAAGIVIIAFGLHLTTLLRIPFLEGQHEFAVGTERKGYWVSFLFGASFAVGWTPCVGPVLGSVLAVAASQPGSSFLLLLAYAAGLGIPFLIVGLFSEQALQLIRKYAKALYYINLIAGVLLIVLGVLVFTQSLELFTSLPALNTLLLRG